jgi:uncharacterized protein YkwD
MNKRLISSFVFISVLLIGMSLIVNMAIPAGAARGRRHHRPVPAPTQPMPAPSSQPGPASSSQLLATQNQYRSQVGMAGLQWSTSLVSSAQNWANYLASIHQLVHSHSGVGENLWMGTTGAYTDAQKVEAWGAEKQYFIAGNPFPNDSTTGNWADVGHYTQLIWFNTTSVGCAEASDGNFDYLVCQYSPPGNVIGQYPLGHP